MSCLATTTSAPDHAHKRDAPRVLLLDPSGSRRRARRSRRMATPRWARDSVRYMPPGARRLQPEQCDDDDSTAHEPPRWKWETVRVLNDSRDADRSQRCRSEE